MDKIRIPFYGHQGPDDIKYVEVEPIEVCDGHALHHTVTWNGFTLDTYTITHIKSGLSAGNPVDNIDDARRKLTQVSEIKVNGVSIGDIGKCEIVQLMPKINDAAADILGFKKPSIKRLLCDQKEVASLLKC